MIAPPARYSILCALVLGCVALLATQGARLGLLPALLLLPLAGWPAWLALAYPATVQRIEARSSLRDGESPWWAPLLGGALWKQVAAVPVAFLAAWSLCAGLIADARSTLAWAGAAAVVLYLLAVPVAACTDPLRPFARPRPVLLVAPAATALLLAAASLVISGLDATQGGTLAQTVAAAPRYEGPSTLLAWAVDGRGLLEGAGRWVLGWIGRQGGWPLAAAWQVAGAVGQFWLLALVFGGLLLPPGGVRRILRPSCADVPLPLGAGRAAIVGFVTTILCLFVTASLARIESWALQRQQPQVIAQAPALSDPGAGATPPALGPLEEPRPIGQRPTLPSPSDLRHVLEADRLGDLACPKGTVDDLRRLDRRVRAVLAAQRAGIEVAARQGFDAMRANVPGYLDWYYSLPAEYARTGHLLVGDAGTYLEDRFREHVERGDPLGPLLAATGTLTGNAEMLGDWKEARLSLLGTCRDVLLPADGGTLVLTGAAPASLLLAGPSIEALDLRTRLGGAGIGGGAGALVGLALGKLVAKEAFGLAVDALGKLALGKVTGWVGGAAAGAGGGALAGSVVPGVGTTIGAAVGGVLGGVVAWVATDAALLALEEAVSRSGFEAEILRAIDETEAEFLASLGPSP